MQYACYACQRMVPLFTIVCKHTYHASLYHSVRAHVRRCMRHVPRIRLQTSPRRMQFILQQRPMKRDLLIGTLTYRSKGLRDLLIKGPLQRDLRVMSHVYVYKHVPDVCKYVHARGQLLEVKEAYQKRPTCHVTPTRPRALASVGASQASCMCLHLALAQC